MKTLKILRVSAWSLIIAGICLGVTLIKFSSGMTIGEFLTTFCIMLISLCAGGLCAIIALSKQDH